MKYVKWERLSLQTNPAINEAWVQDRIAEDPAILGLGDVELRDRERRQPKAGRLDLLLQHVDSGRRYEVELQLGQTDESHIIRTIEYWDIERKRYPQYDHCAVLIAEDITSRFLNVIALFNGAVPLIALQVQALRSGDEVMLVFTKVVDELRRGPVDEDEEEGAAPADRAYWEQRSSKDSLQLADAILVLVRTFAPDVSLKYNKFYIGMSEGGVASNFISMRPKKKFLRLELKVPESTEINERIADAGLVSLGPDAWNQYRLRITSVELQKHQSLLVDLIKQSYEYWGGRT